MREPLVMHAEELARNEVAACIDGIYTPARPIGHPSQLALAPFARFRIAWRVFTGRYDALRWRGQ